MERAYNDEHRMLVQYAEDHSSPEPPYLQDLRRMTYQRTLAPQMLSGHMQGRLLSMISTMHRPRYIVEVGTFTGYATLCLAEGLLPDGRLVTIEVNPELHYISSHFFGQSPYASQIESHVGDAMQLLPDLEHGIDMVWLDAGKKDYADYFDMLLPMMRTGGILMADNVLWDGKVAAGSDDAVTRALRRFNQQVREDDRVQQVILPLRDGITIVRKL